MTPTIIPIPTAELASSVLVQTKGSTTQNKTIANEPQPYTILRIKRKRTDSPLDALLVDAPEKRPRKNIDISQASLNRIFRLAETVETQTFKDADNAKELRERIARTAERRRRMKSNEAEQSVTDRKLALVNDKKRESRELRYKVISRNRTSKGGTLPRIENEGKLDSSWKQVFQVYDAVKEGEADDVMSDEPVDESDVMCNFLPMVKEFLTISDKEPSEPPFSPSDYVYDIYYRDESAEGTTPAHAGNIGSVAWFDENVDLVHEDSDSDDDYSDDDSNAEDYYANDYPDEDESEYNPYHQNDDDIYYRDISGSEDSDDNY